MPGRNTFSVPASPSAATGRAPAGQPVAGAIRTVGMREAWGEGSWGEGPYPDRAGRAVPPLHPNTVKASTPHDEDRMRRANMD